MPIRIRYASMIRVHPMLCRITCPSLRTSLLVETPTLAVCGAIGLPTSEPTELKVGKSKTGRCSNLPVIICTGPNIAFVDVLLPESAHANPSETRREHDEEQADFGQPEGQRIRHPGVHKSVGDREDEKRD